VFTSQRRARCALWIVNAKGGGPEEIRIGRTGDLHVDWSPDGKRIAIDLRDEGDPPDVYTCDPAQERLTRVTENNWGDAHPSWSPDGSMIAYTRPADICIIPAEGGRPKRITKEETDNWHPRWSPDGKYVAFTSDRGGSTEIWVAEVEPATTRD
jgi:TolB protein